MKIKIKRIDKSIPLPEYKTEGAACLDMYSRETITIQPGEIGYIPLNVAIELPKGTCALLVARSSTHKLGLMKVNGVGVFDEDYKGDNDEYKFIAYNFKKQSVTIEKGTRVAQIMIVSYNKVDIEEVEILGNKDRGGIGSTGHK